MSKGFAVAPRSARATRGRITAKFVARGVVRAAEWPGEVEHANDPTMWPCITVGKLCAVVKCQAVVSPSPTCAAPSSRSSHVTRHTFSTTRLVGFVGRRFYSYLGKRGDPNISGHT